MSGIERAFEAFKAICDYMRTANLKYEVPGEENVAFVTIKGEQFPVTLMFSVRADNERVDTYCELPFSVREGQTLSYAKALNAVNGMLPMGKFCYYPQEGTCTYENSEFLSGLSGFTESYGRMIVAGAYTLIQEFISPLFEVACGRMTAEQLEKSLHQKQGKRKQSDGKETI